MPEHQWWYVYREPSVDQDNKDLKYVTRNYKATAEKALGLPAVGRYLVINAGRTKILRFVVTNPEPPRIVSRG